jgi:hypothetical protein
MIFLTSLRCLRIANGAAEPVEPVPVEPVLNKLAPGDEPVRSRSIAITADRFGRNPNEDGRKSASNTGSSTIFAACCATLSRAVGGPAFRTQHSPILAEVTNC